MEPSKKSFCRHLRTKVTYLPDFSDPDSWRTGESTTQQYWCLCTMTTAGPDNDLVAPESCQPTRACYEETEQLR
ncbi:MAG: hypothetical protein D6743_01125 [Calditrichaeota bacterium]|nr:MAG: hypothetical protein D6743_01125 [Calditrichota bacterium]